MITVEKKLNIFSKLILEREQNEVDVKFEEMKKKNEKIIQTQKEKLEEKARRLINNRINKANIEKNAIISNATIESKNKVLSKKKELLDRMLEHIENRAKQFTDTPEYENYLLNSVTEALSGLKGERGANLYLLPKDIERYKEKVINFIIQNGFAQSDIEIISSLDNIIGGVVAVNTDQTIRIDVSIRSIIDDSKSSIGRILFKELKKAGDIVE